MTPWGRARATCPFAPELPLEALRLSRGEPVIETSLPGEHRCVLETRMRRSPQGKSCLTDRRRRAARLLRGRFAGGAGWRRRRRPGSAHCSTAIMDTQRWWPPGIITSIPASTSRTTPTSSTPGRRTAWSAPAVSSSMILTYRASTPSSTRASTRRRTPGSRDPSDGGMLATWLRDVVSTSRGLRDRDRLLRERDRAGRCSQRLRHHGAGRPDRGRRPGRRRPRDRRAEGSRCDDGHSGVEYAAGGNHGRRRPGATALRRGGPGRRDPRRTHRRWRRCRPPHGRRPERGRPAARGRRRSDPHLLCRPRARPERTCWTSAVGSVGRPGWPRDVSTPGHRM